MTASRDRVRRKRYPSSIRPYRPLPSPWRPSPPRLAPRAIWAPGGRTARLPPTRAGKSRLPRVPSRSRPRRRLGGEVPGMAPCRSSSCSTPASPPPRASRRGPPRRRPRCTSSPRATSAPAATPPWPTCSRTCPGMETVEQYYSEQGTLVPVRGRGGQQQDRPADQRHAGQPARAARS